MPNISNRGVAMPSSPIRKLVPYAEAAKSKGIKVFHLNIGQPDIITPPRIMQAVASAALTMKVLEYSHSAGNESLRKKQVNYYNNIGIHISHKEIMMTTGGSEAILFTMLSTLNPGDEVIVPEPFYANYNGFSTIAGVKVVPVRSYIESGFNLPPISDIEDAITTRTKAIMICNPNNPTGYLYSKVELNYIKDIVKTHDLYLFSDEAYKEFCYDNNSFTSALQLEGIEQHVVVFDTISKRYSACGARLGTMLSRNMELMNTALKFAQARLSPPSFAQILAEEAVDLPSDYFESIKAEYCKRRDTIVDRLNKMEGVFCPNPLGTFYAIARLPIDNSDKFCQWLLEKFSYNNSTVMLAPATGFYSTKGAGTDEVRLAYVLNCDEINKAMDCLEAALKEYKQL